jgi:anti-sigma-K factor RskA
MSTSRLGCDEMEELAPDFALGALTGAERAEAVGHLASCTGCQRRVAELAQVVDSLLVLAPEEEPSTELEARVLARTVGVQSGDDDHGRGSPRRRWVLAGSIAAAVLAIAVFAVAAVMRGDRQREDTVRTAVATEDDGRSVCRAVINEVEPAWLFVSLDERDEEQADYAVEVQFDNGEAARVGRIELRDGHGELAVTLDLQGSHARSVRLIGADGELGYQTGIWAGIFSASGTIPAQVDEWQNSRPARAAALKAAPIGNPSLLPTRIPP